MCPRCGKPLDREGHYCSECLVKVREYHRQSRAFYRENHICSECGKIIVPGGERTCPECRAKRENRRKPLTEDQKRRYGENFREYQKFIYRERSENGICTRCGKRKAVPGKKKCVICLDKDAERHRIKREDKPNVRKYRKEHHLCYFCGNPIDLDSANICSTCLKKFETNAKNISSKNKYWKQDNRIAFGGDRK